MGAAPVPGRAEMVRAPWGGTCHDALVAPLVISATVSMGPLSIPARMVPPRQSPATVSETAMSTAKPEPARIRVSETVMWRTLGVRRAGEGRGTERSEVAAA